MRTHPFFTDILMHTDDELAQALGVNIVQRETLHEWPLSCVQRLLLDSFAFSFSGETVISFTDQNAAAFPRRFYRANLR